MNLKKSTNFLIFINGVFILSEYLYKIFGFNIISDFKLEGLMPGDDTPEVEIIRGQVELAKAVEEANISLTVTQSKKFHIKVANIAECLVSNGTKAIIMPLEGANEISIKLAILGVVMNIILLQRGFLAIHGNAVIINGKCVLITGASGSGKSTLTYALRQKGYPFISDDISAVFIKEDGSCWVEAGSPLQKLWKDSAELNGIDIKHLSQVLDETEKYYLPVDDGFQNNSAELSCIIEMDTDDIENVVMKEELKHFSRLAIFLRQTYRPYYLRLLGLSNDHFNKCSYLAKRIPAYQLTRPNNGFTADSQADLIINEINRRHKAEDEVDIR